MVNRPFVYQKNEQKDPALYRVSIHYLPTDKQWLAYVYRMGSNLPSWTSPKADTFLGCARTVNKWLHGELGNG